MRARSHDLNSKLVGFMADSSRGKSSRIQVVTLQAESTGPRYNVWSHALRFVYASGAKTHRNRERCYGWFSQMKKRGGSVSDLSNQHQNDRQSERNSQSDYTSTSSDSNSITLICLRLKSLWIRNYLRSNYIRLLLGICNHYDESCVF